MEFQSIDEIYAANARIREKLRATVAQLPDEVANARPEGEKWSVAEIVEHIAKVNHGALRICGRLLQKAAEVEGTVAVKISDNFNRKVGEIGDMKLEAPEIVRPGGAQTIRDSLQNLSELEAKYAEMKPDIFGKSKGCWKRRTNKKIPRLRGGHTAGAKIMRIYASRNPTIN